MIPADLVLIAAGFLGSQKYVTDAFKVEVDQRNKCGHETGRVRLFGSPRFCGGGYEAGASLWWYGRSGKAGKPPERWTNP